MSFTRKPRLALSLCLLAGMAVVGAPALAQSGGSGFIQNMPADMQPDPAGPGSLRWQSPAANLASYDKVLLQPLTVYVSPDSKEKGLDPDALKSLADSFRSILINQLEPAYPVVDNAGPGVLVVRPALTNVHLEKKSRGLLTFTPVGMLAHAARDAHSKGFALEKAVLEAEVLDGVTGERVSVLVDRSPEKTGGKDADKIDWSRMESALSFYAQRMKQRLDKARGK
jgi:hypothetical protein